MNMKKRQKRVLSSLSNYKQIGLRKDEIVKVISGNHKGQEGKVKKFDRTKGLVFIDKVNIKQRAHKKQKDRAGQFVQVAHGIHVSNVKVLQDEVFVKVSDFVPKPRKVMKKISKKNKEQTIEKAEQSEDSLELNNQEVITEEQLA